MKPITRREKEFILHKLPILPRVIAARVADEFLGDALPFEVYERRTKAFENYAEWVFASHYKTSAPFRKQIARLQDLDDVTRTIYPWFEMWWHAYNHRIARKKLARTK